MNIFHIFYKLIMINNINFVKFESLFELVFFIFCASGSKNKEANILAKNLVEANLVGHDSHGVIRIF